MNKRVRARGCRRIRTVEPNGEGRGGEGVSAGGELETRRILKTFAVLLIFFSKWVKLFYDFQRQFLASGDSLSLSFLRLSSFLASSLSLIVAARGGVTCT